MTENPSVAGSRPASAQARSSALLALAQLVVRRAERVHLGRVAGRERREPRLDGPAEDERRMRLLDRPRQRRADRASAYAAPVVVEALLRPRANDDLDLLGEELEALLRVEEREAVRDVLALVPARPHADLDAAARDVVDGDGHPREHARMPERRRRDERAEPDPLGDRCEPGERRPRVEGVGVGPDDRRVVIGAEEPLEPVVLGERREAHPVVPGDALLALDHQTDAQSDRHLLGSVTGSAADEALADVDRRLAVDEPLAGQERHVLRRADRDDRARLERRERGARDRRVDVADDRDLARRAEPEVDPAERPREAPGARWSAGSTRRKTETARRSSSSSPQIRASRRST